MSPSCPALSLKDIQDAQTRIADAVHRTPVLTSRTLDRLAGRSLYFKAENLQRCGAFKARGALNAVRQLSPTQRARGVITDSSGNHGQALAWAAAEAGVAATVVMPNNAPQVKQDAVRGYGASVVSCPATLEGRRAAVTRLREETGATYVPPFNHPHIQAGQGTVALELLEAVPQLDTLVVPVGGGGLLSGCAVAGQGVRPGLRLVGAEPFGANDTARSLRAGEHLPPVRHNSLAGGLLVGMGPLPWSVIKERVTQVIEVSEDQIVAAMRLVWERMKLVVEPSGAVALAAVLTGSLPARARHVGVVFSGGNVDLGDLPWSCVRRRCDAPTHVG